MSTAETPDPIKAMRYQLNMASSGGGEIQVDSVALKIASQLAVCSMAEDLRAIRTMLASGWTVTEPQRPWLR